MSTIGSIDLSKALVAHWDASGLEWEFKKNWAETDRDEYMALNEANATDQPLPYCLYDIAQSIPMGRSTGEKGGADRIRYESYLVTFKIYTRQITSVNKTSKDIAAELAGKVMSKFGGHNTANYPQLDLDNGCITLAQYMSNQGFDLGDAEYLLTLMYNYQLEMPVVT